MSMRPIERDEFFRLKFLSAPSFSPEGKSACLVVSEIDRKKDEYRSCLWLRRDGKWKKLTSFGRSRMSDISFVSLILCVIYGSTVFAAVARFPMPPLFALLMMAMITFL